MSDAGPYAEDIGAELYDIAFDWRREKEADFAEACAEEFGAKADGAVLDLACGGGHFLHEMQKEGGGWPVWISAHR